MAGFADIALNDEVAAGVVRADGDAIAAAYRVLAQSVMNLAYRLLGDRDLAQEVVQDTFIDLLQKASQIRSAGAVVPWVRKVAVNHCLMRLRSPWHKRRAEEDVDVVLERGAGQGASDPNVGGRWLESALASLPADGRVVVWLHDVEGYTHKEIGSLLGKTASYSKSQLARSYRRLIDWDQGGTSTEADASSAANSETGTAGASHPSMTRGRTENGELADQRSPCPS